MTLAGPAVARLAARLNLTPIVSVAADASALFAQRVAQRAAGLISLTFVSRYLTQGEFGQYQFIGVALGAIGFMSLAGLDNALMQAEARGERGLYRRATSIAFVSSLVGGLLLACGAMACAVFRPAMVTPMLLAAVAFPLYVGLIQWKSILLGTRRFRLLSLTESLNAATTHALLVALVLWAHPSIIQLAAAFLAPTALVNVLMTASTWRRRPGAGRDNASSELFRYGLKSSALNVISVVAEQIERVFIFFVLGPVSFATYIAGDRLSELCRSVVQDLAAVLAPRFARMGTYSGKIRKIIWLLCTVAGVALVVFAFTLAPILLKLIFGAKYAPSIPYAQALLCSVAIGNVGQFQFRFIRSQMDGNAYKHIVLWTSGARILACLILVPLLGIWGAIIGIFLYRGSVSLASSYVISQRYSAEPAQ